MEPLALSPVVPVQPLDVRTYLLAEGHRWRTIVAVVAFMQRYSVPDRPTPTQLRLS